MTQITEELIGDVLDAFYAKVRQDDALGPIFNGIIGDHWAAHMRKINAFWCAALRVRAGYPGSNFMPAHLKHDSIRAAQIERWMTLFERTVDEFVPQDHRERFMWVAQAMSENLRISLDRRKS